VSEPIEAYIYARCSTCRTAEAMIRASGRAAVFRDIFRDKLSRQELVDLLARIGQTPHDLLSTRSIPYRELGLAEKQLSADALLDLMAEYPALLRRPILVIDGQVQVGLNQKTLAAALDAAGATT